MNFKERLKTAAQKFSKSVDAGWDKTKQGYKKYEHLQENYTKAQERYQNKQMTKLDNKLLMEKKKEILTDKKIQLQELKNKNNKSSNPFKIEGGFKL